MPHFNAAENPREAGVWIRLTAACGIGSPRKSSLPCCGVEVCADITPSILQSRALEVRSQLLGSATNT